MGITKAKLKKLKKIQFIREFEKILIDKVLTGELRISDGTIAQYMTEIDLFYRQVNIDYDQKPTKEQALKWVKEMEQKYSRKSRAKKISAINHFLKYCCEFSWKLPMTKNVTRRQEPTTLSEKQIYKMVSLAEAEGKFTKAMLIFTGYQMASRPTPLLSIKLTDIDWEGNRILLVKDKEDMDRWVPLSKRAMQKIREYVEKHRPQPKNEEDAPYLFIEETRKGRCTHGYFSYALHRYAFKLGIEKPVYPHCLRHSRIKELRHRGYSWERIMSLTGHASIMSLSAYIHAEEADELQQSLDEDEGGVRTPIPLSPQELKQELLEKENEKLKAELELLRVQLQSQDTSRTDHKPRMDNRGYV
jgi:site-specific recombinase XerD